MTPHYQTFHVVISAHGGDPHGQILGTGNGQTAGRAIRAAQRQATGKPIPGKVCLQLCDAETLEVSLTTWGWTVEEAANDAVYANRRASRGGGR